MASTAASSDQVISQLIEMGFEYSEITAAVEAVGASINDAVDFISTNYHRKSKSATSDFLGKSFRSSSHSCTQTGQSKITDHLIFTDKPKRSKANVVCSEPAMSVAPAEEHRELLSVKSYNTKAASAVSPVAFDIGSDWEQIANKILHKHFKYSSLKSFQKEALAAWTAHQDCLVLSATGSGKSLCFQIPALLTGKAVVVISPLISLMHDQCLKLAKHGVPACFLGSGQPDSSVEKNAMSGMYDIIYVCPETLTRLIIPLQRLAENRGIALFAIDEVHCVSKWGHDFRPDYRRLSVLRENFNANNLTFLKHDIPLMALTATATVRVQEDILMSLCMSKDTKIVLTTFFRPNLRFSVQHSRTSSVYSYENDFREIIDVYTKKRMSDKKYNDIYMNSKKASDDSSSSANGSTSEGDGNTDDDEACSAGGNDSIDSKGKLSIEFLEDEADFLQTENECDVDCGEFCGQYLPEEQDLCRVSETFDPPTNPDERLKLCKEPLEQGQTIIYVPTRKATLSIAKYLCQHGVKAAAYHAMLPKSHLRSVHKEFHQSYLEVVVATIAFGMGIDKVDVRRVIHYGWPQSLEAYYQEAGRAGRDGKLADCILYANLLRVPTLLPSKRSEEQTKQAYKMLSDCFRYGMNKSCCRAKMLVEYFGEDFNYKECLLCDVCSSEPCVMQNLKEEAEMFMQVLAAYYEYNHADDYGLACTEIKNGKFAEKPNVRMIVSKIREQFVKFATRDVAWWGGLARILADEGYISEGDDKEHVQIRFPVLTPPGLDFLRSLSRPDSTFAAHPEADMLISMLRPDRHPSSAEWGKGWADPVTRRRRLGKRRRLSGRKPWERKPRQRRARKAGLVPPKTVRGRLAAKLSNPQH